MKTLSLKLDDVIFNETESITTKINMTRNRYINEAVNAYNAFNKRKLLKARLIEESHIVSEDSMDVLNDFEMMMDEAI